MLIYMTSLFTKYGETSIPIQVIFHIRKITNGDFNSTKFSPNFSFEKVGRNYDSQEPNWEKPRVQFDKDLAYSRSFILVGAQNFA